MLLSSSLLFCHANPSLMYLVSRQNKGSSCIYSASSYVVAVNILVLETYDPPSFHVCGPTIWNFCAIGHS